MSQKRERTPKNSLTCQIIYYQGRSINVLKAEGECQQNLTLNCSAKMGYKLGIQILDNVSVMITDNLGVSQKILIHAVPSP